MMFKLEKLKENDFELYFQLVSDERVMAMITERALPLDEAKSEYENILLKNAIHPNYGSFKILDSNNTFVGLAKLEIDAREAKYAELGYMLLPQYWGQGITSQIANKLVKQSIEDQQLTQLIAIIDPNNIASRKVLTNNGFISKEFKDFDGLPGEILELNIRQELEVQAQKPTEKHWNNYKFAPKLSYLAIFLFIFILTNFLFYGRKYEAIQIEFLVNIFPGFYQHISNFSLMILLFLPASFIGILYGLPFKKLTIFGLILLAINFIVEIKVSILNTPDIIDAIYGLIGFVISFVYLFFLHRDGLIIFPQQKKDNDAKSV